MAKTRKAKLLPQARVLYAEGLSKPDVAAALGVAPTTVRRWAREDAAAGRPWSRAPKVPPNPETGAAAADPSATARLTHQVQERLQRLIDAGEREPDDPRLEDRMLKLCRVLGLLRDDGDDLAAQLEAMKRFAAFCVANLTESEMRPVRKAVRLFIDHLRKEHS